MGSINGLLLERFLRFLPAAERGGLAGRSPARSGWGDSRGRSLSRLGDLALRGANFPALMPPAAAPAAPACWLLLARPCPPPSSRCAALCLRPFPCPAHTVAALAAAPPGATRTAAHAPARAAAASPALAVAAVAAVAAAAAPKTLCLAAKVDRLRHKSSAVPAMERHRLLRSKSGM